ncbi:MAG: hypothetical protein PHY93_17070 [Bacteriovorax sp.]|nr:hypothetical protein [Bacteriovorax sp.]
MKILLFVIIVSNLHAVEKSPAMAPNIIIDKDGDKIITLDMNVRNKLRSLKEIKANQLYDNDADLRKNNQEDEKDILKKNQVMQNPLRK